MDCTRLLSHHVLLPASTPWPCDNVPWVIRQKLEKSVLNEHSEWAKWYIFLIERMTYTTGEFHVRTDLAGTSTSDVPQYQPWSTRGPTSKLPNKSFESLKCEWVVGTNANTMALFFQQFPRSKGCVSQYLLIAWCRTCSNKEFMLHLWYGALDNLLHHMRQKSFLPQLCIIASEVSVASTLNLNNWWDRLHTHFHVSPSLSLTNLQHMGNISRDCGAPDRDTPHYCCVCLPIPPQLWDAHVGGGTS